MTDSPQQPDQSGTAGGPVPPTPPASYPAPAQPTQAYPGAVPTYPSPYGQAPYGQAPYGQAPQGYGRPYGGTAPRRTNTFALVSFISSLVGIVFSWTWVLGLGLVVGVIFGHLALGQLRRTGEQGRGFAIAGVVIGWVGIGLAVLGIIAFVLLFAVAGTAGYAV